MTASIIETVALLKRFRKSPLTQLADALNTAVTLRIEFDKLEPWELEERVGNGDYTLLQVKLSGIASNRKSLTKKIQKALPLLIQKREHVLIRSVYDLCRQVRLNKSELQGMLDNQNYELRNEEGLLPDEAEVWDSFNGSKKSLIKATLPLDSSPSSSSRKAASP